MKKNILSLLLLAISFCSYGQLENRNWNLKARQLGQRIESFPEMAGFIFKEADKTYQGGTNSLCKGSYTYDKQMNILDIFPIKSKEPLMGCMESGKYKVAVEGSTLTFTKLNSEPKLSYYFMTQ